MVFILSFYVLISHRINILDVIYISPAFTEQSSSADLLFHCII